LALSLKKIIIPIENQALKSHPIYPVKTRNPQVKNLKLPSKKGGSFLCAFVRNKPDKRKSSFSDFGLVQLPARQ
jgi:hypothetical protein